MTIQTQTMLFDSCQGKLKDVEQGQVCECSCRLEDTALFAMQLPILPDIFQIGTVNQMMESVGTLATRSLDSCS